MAFFDNQEVVILDRQHIFNHPDLMSIFQKDSTSDDLKMIKIVIFQRSKRFFRDSYLCSYKSRGLVNRTYPLKF